MSFSKDIAAGLLCIAIGAFFSLQALFHLDLGGAARMGPGYYPLIVAGILVLFGIVIFIGGLAAEHTVMAPVSVRGVALVTLAPALFGLSVRPLGLAIAIALTAVTSAFASRQVGLVAALLTTVILCAFCIAVFSYGLGMNLPLVGTLFDV